MKSINVIAISPHLFSGSYFFQALLDGHPELYSLGTHFAYPSKIKTNEDIKTNFNIGKTINRDVEKGEMVSLKDIND